MDASNIGVQCRVRGQCLEMVEDVSNWASLEEAFHHGHGEEFDAERNVEGILTTGGSFCSSVCSA